MILKIVTAVIFISHSKEVIPTDKLYQLAKGYTNRFPNGNDPYQITARILEECGEVASEVNHFEKSGIKMQKHGEPSKQHLADEIKQAVNALIQLAVYYRAENELEASIDRSLEKMKKRACYKIKKEDSQWNSSNRPISKSLLIPEWFPASF